MCSLTRHLKSNYHICIFLTARWSQYQSCDTMWCKIIHEYAYIMSHTCDNNYQSLLDVMWCHKTPSSNRCLRVLGFRESHWALYRRVNSCSLDFITCIVKQGYRYICTHVGISPLKNCCKRTCFDPLVGRWYSLNCFFSCLSFMILKHIFGSRGSWRFGLRKRD